MNKDSLAFPESTERPPPGSRVCVWGGAASVEEGPGPLPSRGGPVAGHGRVPLLPVAQGGQGPLRVLLERDVCVCLQESTSFVTNIFSGHLVPENVFPFPSGKERPL